MVTVLGDLVSRERRSDRPALRVDASDRTVSYREFCTTVWKAGHALRHLGVHEGSRVALASAPTPRTLQTFIGGALLGARTVFDATADARVVVGPVDDEDNLSVGDRTVVVYGGAPEQATTTHWESVVWSENPAPPPGGPSPDATALDGSGTDAVTHRELLSQAAHVADSAGLDSETSVAIRSSLADSRTVVAGVLAPLLAGRTVVIPGERASADVAVSDDEVPEPRRIPLDAVPGPDRST